MNGGWSAWSSWTDCLSPCDEGVAKRNRTCTEPVPTDDGLYCLRDENGMMGTETEPCNVRACQAGQFKYRSLTDC